MKKDTIDDITMIECCMIMMGFGQVWEHDVKLNYCVLVPNAWINDESLFSYIPLAFV